MALPHLTREEYLPLALILVTIFLSVVGQYQIELFWLGLVSNAAGIVYIGGKLKKFINEKRN